MKDRHFRSVRPDEPRQDAGVDEVLEGYERRSGYDSGDLRRLDIGRTVHAMRTTALREEVDALAEAWGYPTDGYWRTLTLLNRLDLLATYLIAADTVYQPYRFRRNGQVHSPEKIRAVESREIPMDPETLLSVWRHHPRSRLVPSFQEAPRSHERTRFRDWQDESKRERERHADRDRRQVEFRVAVAATKESEVGSQHP